MEDFILDNHVFAMLIDVILRVATWKQRFSALFVDSRQQSTSQGPLLVVVLDQGSENGGFADRLASLGGHAGLQLLVHGLDFLGGAAIGGGEDDFDLGLDFLDVGAAIDDEVELERLERLEHHVLENALGPLDLIRIVAILVAIEAFFDCEDDFLAGAEVGDL